MWLLTTLSTRHKPPPLAVFPSSELSALGDAYELAADEGFQEWLVEYDPAATAFDQTIPAVASMDELIH